jgi:hypothetical protein
MQAQLAKKVLLKHHNKAHNVDLSPQLFTHNVQENFHLCFCVIVFVDTNLVHKSLKKYHLGECKTIQT